MDLRNKPTLSDEKDAGSAACTNKPVQRATRVLGGIAGWDPRNTHKPSNTHTYNQVGCTHGGHLYSVAQTSYAHILTNKAADAGRRQQEARDSWLTSKMRAHKTGPNSLKKK